MHKYTFKRVCRWHYTDTNLVILIGVARAKFTLPYTFTLKEGLDCIADRHGFICVGPMRSKRRKGISCTTFAGPHKRFTVSVSP